MIPAQFWSVKVKAEAVPDSTSEFATRVMEAEFRVNVGQHDVSIHGLLPIGLAAEAVSYIVKKQLGVSEFVGAAALVDGGVMVNASETITPFSHMDSPESSLLTDIKHTGVGGIGPRALDPFNPGDKVRVSSRGGGESVEGVVQDDGSILFPPGVKIPMPAPQPQRRPDFADFAEAFCSGWNALKQHGPVNNGEEFARILMDAYESSGSQRAKRLVEQMEDQGD